jgi:hypothetical protein
MLSTSAFRIKLFLKTVSLLSDAYVLEEARQLQLLGVRKGSGGAAESKVVLLQA